MSTDEIIDNLNIAKALLEWEAPLDIYMSIDKAIQIIKDIEKLKADIKLLKHSITSLNSDYLTGYMCALSVVEGMIAGGEINE